MQETERKTIQQAINSFEEVPLTFQMFFFIATFL